MQSRLGLTLAAVLVSITSPIYAEIRLELGDGIPIAGGLDSYDSMSDPAYTGGPLVTHTLAEGHASGSVDGLSGTLKAVAVAEFKRQASAGASLSDVLHIVGAHSSPVNVTVRASLERALQLSAADDNHFDLLASASVTFNVHVLNGVNWHCSTIGCCGGSNCSGPQDEMDSSGQTIALGQSINYSGGSSGGPQHVSVYKGLWRQLSDIGPGLGGPDVGGPATDDVEFTVARDPALPFTLAARIAARGVCYLDTCRFLADAGHSVYLSVTTSDGTLMSESGYAYLGRGGSATTTTTLPGGPCACDDGDACTDDSCTGDGGCASALHPGLDGASCECGSLPPAACAGTSLPHAVSADIKRGCQKLGMAGTAKPKKQAKLLHQARARLAGITHALDSKRGRALPPDCSAALRTRSAAVVQGIAGVQ